MPNIKKLPENVIAKVAAGEVIERPASVVKELIENSLDAECNSIKISIENAGFDLIEVVDDGKGMEKEDMQVCFKRHTTSKIYEEDDLFFISSFGFRGEALYSISSISKTIIKSKPSGTVEGYKLEVSEGEVENTSSVGIPKGTNIKVKRLFENTPARKKFLKSKKTEFRHITSVVESYALGHPEVGFRLKHNGNLVFNLPKNQSLQERVQDVLGEGYLDKLISINSERENISLSGLISTPQLNRGGKQDQYLFVNGRLVESKSISKSIKSAYGSLLDARSYPVFILNIKISPDLIDVNVHPQKTKIDFVAEDITSILSNLVKETLNENDLTYKKKTYDDSEDTYDFISDKLEDYVVPWSVKDDFYKEKQEILQINNLYLVTKYKNGIILIDQHAAHEKILYEQFVNAFKNKAEETKKLEKPVVINLSKTKTQLLEENKDFLNSIGFEVEAFGGDSFKISVVPSVFNKDNLQSIVEEFIDSILNKNVSTDLTNSSKKALSYMACRTAIKAGEYLTPSERRKLVKRVLESKNTYTCPHGRPVKIKMDMKELNKMFKRK